jgi:hypothetical protein
MHIASLEKTHMKMIAPIPSSDVAVLGFGVVNVAGVVGRACAIEMQINRRWDLMIVFFHAC